MNIDISRQNTRIVIATNLQSLLDIYKKFLEKAGLKVLATFSNATDLITFFDFHSGKSTGAELQSSIVLLDSRIAGMSHEELVGRIREISPGQKIILTTEKDRSAAPFDTKRFDAVIQKPFTISELLDAILRVTSPIWIRGSTIINDSEEMYGLLSNILSISKESVWLSLSSTGIHRRIDIPEYSPVYLKAAQKGLDVRLIVEVTRDNFFACKELILNRGVQLRHLEGVVNNFSLYDEKHLVEATLLSADGSV